MVDRRCWLGWVFACGLLAACADQVADDPVAVTSAALSVCNETVPADRNIDGFPAYEQCDAAANSAIYSNNGIDTATTAMGSDWVRTQWSGGYQCTELAHRYLHFKWQVDWIPNGNAGEWCDETPPANSGLVQTMVPVHGDIMVLAPGSCGAAQGTGHVNVIDIVGPNDKLTAVEQNQAGRNSWYTTSCAKCFLHVVANDGSASGGMMASGTGGKGAAGMGASGAGGMGAGGAGAVPGSGGMFAPPMQPAQAGTSAPPPVTPVMNAPVTQPPVVPPPAMTAPANTVPAGTGGVGAGSGGGAAMMPYTFSTPPRRQVQEPGCSVVRTGAGTGGGSQYGFVLLALARIARRRSRLFAFGS
jgi:MYXO-CTERM domain-containing protein